jgi:GT2 family glycosyltransferase
MTDKEDTYAIVIPACETVPECRNLLNTLLTSIRWGKYSCPVIVCYDNCSADFVTFFETEFSDLRLISLIHRGDKNLNFAANANRGLRKAYNDLHLAAFCINQDCALPHRSLLEKVINSGIASPKPIDVEGTVQAKFTKLNQMVQLPCPCRGEKWEGMEPTNKFAAFCIWISKYAFSKIGFFDEKTFEASFEDDDYCVRACLAGLPCEQSEIPVHHEGGRTEDKISTTGAYNMASLVNHLNRFRTKWYIPPAVSHGSCAEFILQNYKWSDTYRCE